MPEAPKRYAHIDLIKCLAILLVVLYHGTLYAYDFTQEARALYYLRYGLRSLSSAGVPLFFIASGYLLFSRPVSLKRHAVKTLTLAVLTVLWAAINLAALMPIKGEFMRAGEFLRALWEWKSGWIDQFWFMGALVCLYIFFPLLKLAFDERPKLFAIFTLICAVLTFGSRFLNMLATIGLNACGVHHYVDVNIFNMFNPLRIVPGYALVYFCTGGLAFRVEPWLRARKNTRSSLLAILGVVVSMALLTLWGVYSTRLTVFMWDLVWSGYDTVFTLALTGLLYFLCLGYRGEAPLCGGFIRRVSGNTFGIYCMHMILIALTRPLVLRVGVFASLWANVLYALLVVAVCLGASLLIKKIPLVKRMLI